MSCKKLISIIIPIYNVEKWLDRCIESVVCQTYSNLEIILVDDGSPDNCPCMCDRWEKRDSRIKVIHKRNGGLSDARNEGLKIATGEYIGFVDSDDWIAPEMYERLQKAIVMDHSDIAACGVEMVWEDGTPSRMLTKSGCCVLNHEEAMQSIIEESWLKHPVWYKLYKAELIRGIVFPVGKYHEDVFWSYQAIGKAKKVSVLDEVGYYYVQRGDSIMGDGYSLKRLDALEAYCNQLEYIRKEYPNLEKKSLCKLWTVCIYNGQMSLRFLHNQERKHVFSYLKKIMKQYPILSDDYQESKITHKINFFIARISLHGICYLRNILNIGI